MYKLKTGRFTQACVALKQFWTVLESFMLTKCVYDAGAGLPLIKL